jgi:ubiquitin carboxyl-terminal hydrolase MINDY-1/2
MSHFKLKEIDYFNRKLKILCQNLNGPCPLLSLCNVLILNGKISIHSDYEHVSLEMITHLIANELLEKELSHDGSPEMKVLHQERLGVAISMLPSLQRGLDVNVKFNDVSSFEYTRELDCFDAFSVPLYHGWIYDHQDRETRAVIKDMTYNHLLFKLVEASGLTEGQEEEDDVEKQKGRKIDETDASATVGETKEGSTLKEEEKDGTTSRTQEEENTEKIDGKEQDTLIVEVTAAGDLVAHADTKITAADGCKDDVERETNSHDVSTKPQQKNALLHHEANVIKRFLADTASQLTYAGLLALHDTIPEGSLCTFFRNNHFSTMLKRENSLYLLVTDLGYADKPNVVWELLDEIDGNTELVDSHFHPIATGSGSVPASNVGNTNPAVSASTPIIDPDYLMALRLSEQSSAQQHQQGAGTTGMHPDASSRAVGYARPPMSASPPSPPDHLLQNYSDADERGVPVTISPSSDFFVGQATSGTTRDITTPHNYIRSSQEERDRQAALALQASLQQEEASLATASVAASASSQGRSDSNTNTHNTVNNHEVHHLQQSLSPAELDSYRQAELEYFRNKDQPAASQQQRHQQQQHDENQRRSRARKKKEDSSSGCTIA